MKSAHRVLALLMLAAAGGACAPSIRIAHDRPPRMALGDATVALEVAAEGRKSSGSEVVTTVASAVQGQRRDKWVAVETLRGELDAALRKAGQPVVEPGQAQYVVYLVPVAWSFSWSLPELPKNRYDMPKARPGDGSLKVRVEVVEPGRRDAPRVVRTYRGHGRAHAEDKALLTSSRQVAARFVRDLRPRRVWHEVKLDGSDRRIKPAVKLAKSGQFLAAYASLTDLVAVFPDSAPAKYNLAILCEARGEFDAAEGLLLRAIRLKQKPLYHQALERTRRARADTEALDEEPEEAR